MSSNLVLLGKRIRALRKAKGITQEELAGLAESGSKYISEVERGEANLTVNLLDKIADALDVETSALLTYQHEAGREELESTIAEMISKGSYEQVQLLYRIAREILK